MVCISGPKIYEKGEVMEFSSSHHYQFNMEVTPCPLSSV